MDALNPHIPAFHQKPLWDARVYAEKIRGGDRVALSQAITLAESATPAKQDLGQEIIALCLPNANHSFRLGITGSPGVGKSSFIETFGLSGLERGKKIAILAIDPSSRINKGSILGDKTRMLELGKSENVFIRPSPAGETLGGVARKTRETIILCEAAGFDTIVVETVGVGQSETAVHSMTDFFMLLLLPGAGDELQGIKRGIVEMADLIAVNKADGDRETAAKQARASYNNALHLFPAKESGQIPKVVTCSALTGAGTMEIWQIIDDYLTKTTANGFFEFQRKRQAVFWMHETINQAILAGFYNNADVRENMEVMEKEVISGSLSPFKAAEELLKMSKS